jgi:hypothetical protein
MIRKLKNESTGVHVALCDSITQRMASRSRSDAWVRRLERKISFEQKSRKFCDVDDTITKELLLLLLLPIRRANNIPYSVRAH